MGNIIGNAFDDKVNKQIEIRESKLGEENRTELNDNNLKWQNNTNAFLRLASSVNISPEISQRIFNNNNYADGKLAEAFMLFNGVTQNKIDEKNNILRKTDENGNEIIQQGINRSGDLINGGAYGFGGLEMGYRPMPGLLGAKITFYNRGSLIDASIQIKAFTPKQFEIIELLYMRVGYSILLEWGHNQYLNNEGNLISQEYYTTDPLSQLFSQKANLEYLGLNDQINIDFSKATIETMLAAIKKERSLRSYNYDAMFGRIKNFNWTFNADGTYDITISVISWGDIIESLNLNKSITNQLNLIVNKQPLIPEGSTLDKKETNQLLMESITEPIDNTLVVKENLQFLGYDFDEDIIDKAEKELTSSEEKEDNQIPDDAFLSPLHKYLWITRAQLDKLEWENKSVNTSTDSLPFSSVKINFKNLDIKEKEKDNSNSQYYIKLGLLLKFIEENLLYYSENENRPLVQIDYDLDNNFCLTYPQQFPANPMVSLIPVGYQDENSKWNYLGDFLGQEFFVSNNRYVGKLMHIHVNMNYIVSTFNGIQENSKESKVSLFKFLQNLMNGIAKSLGGVNNFTVTYNNETNKVVIREDNNLRYGNLVKRKKPTEFNIYGFNKGRGSIVTDINFNVQIGSNFSTMVSVGAQNNGNVLGENGTLLSQLYRGSTDRIIPTKKSIGDLTANSIGLENEELDDSLKKQKDGENIKNKIPINKLNSTLKSLYSPKTLNLNTSNINVLGAISSTYSKYITGYLNNINQIPALGFFPFDFQLTLQGISGIRVYEKFSTTADIFPSMYRKEDGKPKMDFIIKGVTHDIINNKWNTTLNTLSMPTEPEGEIIEYVIPPAPITEEFPPLLTAKDLHYEEEHFKNQIYIHHTVSSHNIKGVIGWWKELAEKSGKQVLISTPYIIDDKGRIEELYDPKYWAYHLGVKGGLTPKLDKQSIGIELTNAGPLIVKDGKYYSESLQKYFDEKDVAVSLDRKGNPAPYKGYLYWEKYTDKQLTALRDLLLYLIENNNIRFRFRGNFLYGKNWDAFFDLNQNALQGKVGVYTHNSVRLDKSDISPQEGIFKMFSSVINILLNTKNTPKQKPIVT